MNLSRQPSPRGFAVIIALVAVTVLSIMAGALALSMKVETRLAINTSDDEKLLWIGRGGVEAARWFLAMEPQGPTSLQQLWAGGPGEGPETNTCLPYFDLHHIDMGDGWAEVDLEEQEGKVNINAADSEMLRQIFTTLGVDAGDISELADSIQDWIDKDDATRTAGAESDYYQGLVPPYDAKNAPMDSIDELQLTKGWIDVLKRADTQGSYSSPYEHHQLGFGNATTDPDELMKKLRKVFTPYSNGKININTADTNVLSVIPGMDTPTLLNIESLREGTGLDGSSMINNLSQLRSIVSNPQQFQQISRYCTTRGETYEVHVTAHVGSSSRQFIAVVYRDQRNKVTVVAFHPK